MEKQRKGAGVWRRLLGLFAPETNLTGEDRTPRRDGKTPFVDRFAGVLSVLHEDERHGLFLLNRGGMTAVSHAGVVFELAAPLGYDAAGAQALERLLRIEMPPGTVFAMSLFASSRVDAPLADWLAARAPEAMRVSAGARAVLSRMAWRRARFFSEKALTARHGNGMYPVRRFRVWLTVTCPLTLDAATGAIDAPDPAFLTGVEAVETLLTQWNLAAYRWTGRDYTRTMRELVNPQSVRRGTHLRSDAAGRVLRDTVVAADTRIDVRQSDIRFVDVTPDGSGEGVRAVALGVHAYPAHTHVNVMGALMGSGQLSGALLPYPYVVTTLVEPTPLAADRANVAVKAARVKQLKHTEIGVFLSDLAQRDRDLTIAQEACEAGVGLARIAHELVVFAPDGAAAGAAEMAKSVLNEAGLEGRIDAGLQLMGLMATLPLEAADGLMKDMKTARRTATVTRTAASHLLPAVGDCRGSGARAGHVRPTPLLLLTTRRGGLFGFDLFANRNGNYNAVVAGTSGSGKSVLAQELVTSVLATGGRVWVFDVGESYRHCAELTDGQWLDFDASGLCINPLDVAGDAMERIDELAQIVTVMANGDAPLELTQSEWLKRALLVVIETARREGRTPTMTDLTLHLMRPENAALADVAVRLMPYAAGGRYAKWFDGPTNVNFDSPLVVLEMQALMQKPVLQSVALLILILRIFEAIRVLPRDEKKLVVIDEAWRLLSGNTGRFVEWACRTLRKYGAGIVCISQSVEDFAVSSAARAMRMNADTVFLLRQKAAGVAAYTDDPALRRLLAGLTTESERFSEVYVKSGDTPGVVARLALDPFCLTAYSTRADVFEAVKNAKREGLTSVEAIERVAKETAK